MGVTGDDIITLEASKNAEYTDAGATCSDWADGQIDHQVVVHGDVVNARVPGDYIIKYDCTDSSGNQADTMRRTVTIVDTECPYLRLLGGDTITIEAGFPYKDSNATATDTLDGDLTKRIHVEGGPYKDHFVTERSCAGIKLGDAGVNGGGLNQQGFVAPSGIYNVLTNVNTDAGLKHEFQQVYCEMWSDGSQPFTVFIHHGSGMHTDRDVSRERLMRQTHQGWLALEQGTQDSLDMIVPYTESQQGACADYGMVMADWTELGVNAEDFAVRYAQGEGDCPACVQQAAQDGNGKWKFSTTVRTTDYFCVPGVDMHIHHDTNANDLNVAETMASGGAGTFVMTFKVHDRAGNGFGEYGTYSNVDMQPTHDWQNLPLHRPLRTHLTVEAHDTRCRSRSMKKRTVIVEDTLPPVITLFLNRTRIQMSQGGDSKHAPGYHNPAATRDGHTQDAHEDGYPLTSPTQNTLTPSVGGNPFFDSYMAEQTTTVNGWLIAAAASAVAGVALMATTMKATTTVPV